MINELVADFRLPCVDSRSGAPFWIQRSDFVGRWLMLIFYPRDFSFVCPTELTAFGARIEDFRRLDCAVLGVSVDSLESHQRWLATSPAEGGLGPLSFPLASDTDGQVARQFRVWDDQQRVSRRGLFIVNPDGLAQYAVVHNLSVGRNADEVLRVLAALQTGGLCPASWTRSDGTLDPELSRGRVLGHYRIERELGQGTFGTVLAAWDLHLERMVALKVLRQHLGQARELLLAEARSAAALSHANVCTIYAVEELDGLPVIAMEYLEGRPLGELIADRSARRDAADLARQMAAGLAAAHARDIVHGDLKPANVIVSENQNAKILDFGLARARGIAAAAGGDTSPSDDPDATVELPGGSDSQLGSIAGTPAYMSPEQARGEGSQPASDVFSLGMILYEMLTGERMVCDKNPIRLIETLAQWDRQSLTLSAVPARYHQVLASMLSSQIDTRPTMSDLVRALA